jgi:hypothetical protein
MNREPIISWNPAHCRFCDKPLTGCTNCDEMGNGKPQGYTLNDTFVPIRSKSCPLRNAKNWMVNINYPFSQPLQTAIAAVPGVVTVQPIGPYEFFVEVGKVFQNDEIQRKINSVFISFVKSHQQTVKEFSAPAVEAKEIFKFPNDKEIIVDQDVKEILEKDFT